MSLTNISELETAIKKGEGGGGAGADLGGGHGGPMPPPSGLSKR